MSGDKGASADAEVWRIVDGHADYLVSSMGRVRHRRVGAPILKGDIDRYGYQRVLLNKKRRKVHRLVCEAFHGLPKVGQEVRHLDGDRSNNRADNLAWGTRSENVQDAVRHGTHAFVLPTARNARRGEASPHAKLTDDKVRAIRASAKAGHAERAIARAFGMSPGQVHKIISREAWPHVQD